MNGEITIEALKAKFEAANHYVDAFDFVDLNAAAWSIRRSKRTVERMIKTGHFLPGEVVTRKGSRRLAIAALVRWHEDGLLPEDRAA